MTKKTEPEGAGDLEQSGPLLSVRNELRKLVSTKR